MTPEERIAELERENRLMNTSISNIAAELVRADRENARLREALENIIYVGSKMPWLHLQIARDALTAALEGQAQPEPTKCECGCNYPDGWKRAAPKPEPCKRCGGDGDIYDITVDGMVPCPDCAKEEK